MCHPRCRPPTSEPRPRQRHTDLVGASSHALLWERPRQCNARSPATQGDEPDRRLPVKLKAMDQATDHDSTQLDETVPSSDVEPMPSSDVETRPWWHSKLNLGVLALAIAVLCGALGWVVGNNRAHPRSQRNRHRLPARHARPSRAGRELELLLPRADRARTRTSATSPAKSSSIKASTSAE